MSKKAPSKELKRIIESAQRLGVEMDESDALQWLTAMASMQPGDEIVQDERTGIFGHKVTMLDFSQEDLEHFRQIGRLVEFKDTPGKVETALALSGSAAQSKIQTYPGDADYFERVNIIAESREAACQILVDLMQEKVRDAYKGPTYLMIEIKFGNYPQDLVRGDRKRAKGTPVSWTPDEILAG